MSPISRGIYLSHDLDAVAKDHLTILGAPPNCSLSLAPSSRPTYITLPRCREKRPPLKLLATCLGSGGCWRHCYRLAQASKVAEWAALPSKEVENIGRVFCNAHPPVFKLVSLQWILGGPFFDVGIYTKLSTWVRSCSIFDRLTHGWWALRCWWPKPLKVIHWHQPKAPMIHGCTACVVAWTTGNYAARHPQCTSLGGTASQEIQWTHKLLSLVEGSTGGSKNSEPQSIH